MLYIIKYKVIKITIIRLIKSRIYRKFLYINTNKVILWEIITQLCECLFYTPKSPSLFYPQQITARLSSSSLRVDYFRNFQKPT